MTATRCARCNRALTKKSAVPTRVGLMCHHHADRLPSHLRRPPAPTTKAAAS